MLRAQRWCSSWKGESTIHKRGERGGADRARAERSLIEALTTYCKLLPEMVAGLGAALLGAATVERSVCGRDWSPAGQRPPTKDQPHLPSLACGCWCSRAALDSMGLQLVLMPLRERQRPSWLAPASRCCGWWCMNGMLRPRSAYG